MCEGQQGPTPGNPCTCTSYDPEQEICETCAPTCQAAGDDCVFAPGVPGDSVAPLDFLPQVAAPGELCITDGQCMDYCCGWEGSDDPDGPPVQKSYPGPECAECIEGIPVPAPVPAVPAVPGVCQDNFMEAGAANHFQCAPKPCAPGCYAGWPGDGYCDEDCKNEACGDDGGDCPRDPCHALPVYFDKSLATCDMGSLLTNLDTYMGGAPAAGGGDSGPMTEQMCGCKTILDGAQERYGTVKAVADCPAGETNGGRR